MDLKEKFKQQSIANNIKVLEIHEFEKSLKTINNK